MIREIFAWVIEAAIVVALAYVLVYFLGFRTTVIGRSMEPVLCAQDQILIDRFQYRILDPKQDDIIVFRPNGNEKSHLYVKRVIGVPGDTVQIRGGVLYVNDKPYEGATEYPPIEDSGIADEPIYLNSGEFFVLGDDLDGSEDSRYANIGNINKQYIIGKAWFILSPQSRFGFL